MTGEVQDHRWACHIMEEVKIKGEKYLCHSEDPQLLDKNVVLEGWE